MDLIGIIIIVCIVAAVLWVMFGDEPWVAADPETERYQCDLYANPIVGYPERCGNLAAGFYTDTFGTRYLACESHCDEAIA